MSSPTRESLAALASGAMTADLHAPPPPTSPRTHRQLRRLQSAHNLGAAARSTSASGPPPGLIAQQRLRDLAAAAGRDASPTRRVVSNRSPAGGRTRANSDAPAPLSFVPPNTTGSSLARQRLTMVRTSPAADAVSLERLLRDGPPDSDLQAALESARLKVLDQGIKSDGDGMVRPVPTHPPTPGPGVASPLVSHLSV